MRKIWAVPAVLIVLAGASWFVLSPDQKPAAAPARAAVAVATLERQDLTSSISLTGQLGYGTARTVKGGRAGTVTWLPAQGTVVRRGQQLYRVDDKPVPLFFGSLPLFRTLSQPNTVGRDVRVVRQNLKALGYAVGRRYAEGDWIRQATPSPTPASSATVTPTASSVEVRAGEDVFTSALISAVKRWQRDVGLPVTGTIAMGDVAVLGGSVRVESLAALTGDAAQSPLMSVTPIAKVISVRAELAEAGSIHRGDRVTVRLPGEKSVPGKVSGLATALVADPDTDGPPTLTVTIALDDPAAVAKLDAAPVEVEFPHETRKDALVAPIGALLALAEGGYAVQLESGATVAAETGLFAGGMVEISGTGLAEGTRVVTTS